MWLNGEEIIMLWSGEAVAVRDVLRSVCVCLRERERERLGSVRNKFFL